MDSRETGFVDYIAVDEFTKKLARPLTSNEITAFI